MNTSGRARWPVAGVFAWFGAVLGSFAVIALDVQTSLGLGPGGFGALLAIGFALGAVAHLAGGAFVERYGEDGALQRVVLVFAATLVAAVMAPVPAVLGVAIAAVLGAAGALNATLNACATSIVAGDTRRFVRYHAGYSAGAFGGAVLTAVIAGGGASWKFVWLTLVLAGLALAVPAKVVENGPARPRPGAAPPLASLAPHCRPVPWRSRSRDRRARPETCHNALGYGGRAPTFTSTSMRSVLAMLRTPAVCRLAVLLFIAVAAASAVDTWGVRFLRIEHGTSVVGGAGAYAAAQLVAVVARLRLVPSSHVRRAEPVVVASGMLAVGLVVECAAAAMWMSAAGLGAATVASALLVPLLLARSDIGSRPAAAVAAVGAVGQLGFVIGPALAGTMTAMAGSAAGLVVVAALAVLTAVGARYGLAVDAKIALDDSETPMSRAVEPT